MLALMLKKEMSGMLFQRISLMIGSFYMKKESSYNNHLKLNMNKKNAESYPIFF